MKGMIFTYVLTYGGAIVSIFNPYVGLLIYICFAIVRPEKMWSWSFEGGGHGLSQIVAIALLGGWALNGFGNWKFGRARAIVIALVSYLTWSAISALAAATDQRLALSFVEDTAKIVLPFLVGVTTIDSVKRLKQLAWVLTLSSGYVALRENEQYLEWGMEVLDNMTAHAMAISAGVAFFTGLLTTNLWARLSAFAASALCIHAVLIHMSRGAMLGVCALAGATFIVLPKTPRLLALYGLALAVGFYMAGPPVIQEFRTAFASEQERDASAQSRFDLWSAMGEEAMNHPLLGLGPYQWRLNAHKHGFPPGKDGHGLWFQVPAELGFPGAAFLMSFYGFVMWRCFLMIRRKRPEHQSLIPFAQLTVASLACFVVEQCFGSFYGMEIPFYVTLVGAAALKQATVASAEARQAEAEDDAWTHDDVESDWAPEDEEELSRA